MEDYDIGYLAALRDQFKNLYRIGEPLENGNEGGVVIQFTDEVAIEISKRLTEIIKKHE